MVGMVKKSKKKFEVNVKPDKKKAQLKIYLFANAITSLTGSDKRFIELSKRWTRKGCNVNLMTPKIGYELCKKEGLEIKYNVLPFPIVDKFGIIFAYVFRTILACMFVPKINERVIIYSTSDFLPDTLPALLMKKRNSKSKFIALIFHLIPPPSRRDGSFIRNLLSYFSQRISLKIIKRHADTVIVDNNILKNSLLEIGFVPERVKVVPNGIDLKFISQARSNKKIYDAVFLGRLQPSKGIFDLVKIWELVSLRKKDAKLGIIGSGDEKILSKLKSEVKRLDLQNNMSFLGFIETNEVYEIIKSSKVFVFPNHEEGWGIAICEAMACKLPVVAYDLPVYKDVFKDVVITVPVGSIDEFSNVISGLLSDEKLCSDRGERGYEIASEYDWDGVVSEELSLMKMLLELDTTKTGGLYNKNILVVGHITEVFGPVQALSNYIEGRVKEFVLITHPFHYSTITSSETKLFIDGMIERHFKSPKLRGHEILHYSKDVAFTFYCVFRLRKKFDLFIGFDNLSTLLGIILRKLKIVNTVIYYSLEYTKARFHNPVMNYLYHYMNSICIRHADLIWSISPRIAEEWDKGGVDKNRSIVVSNGVETEKIVHPTESILRNTLVVISHLVESKGIQLIINAMPEISNKIPDIKLFIVGTGPYENELKKMVRDSNIEKHVTFVGFMNHGQLYRFVPQCNVGIAPYTEDPNNITIWADPTKLKEYLACGLPVITTRVPAFASEIEKNKAGIVINYNEKELIRAILTLLSNDRLYGEYKKNALRLGSNYDSKKIYDEAFLNYLKYDQRRGNGQKTNQYRQKVQKMKYQTEEVF